MARMKEIEIVQPPTEFRMEFFGIENSIWEAIRFLRYTSQRYTERLV